MASIHLFISDLFKILSHELRSLAFREKKKEVKGNLNSKDDGIQPQIYNFLNFQESPAFQWPSSIDQAQIQYQRSVQQLLKPSNTSVTFAKLQGFKTEACDSKLYKIQIPVSPKLEPVAPSGGQILNQCK